MGLSLGCCTVFAMAGVGSRLLSGFHPYSPFCLAHNVALASPFFVDFTVVGTFSVFRFSSVFVGGSQKEERKSFTTILFGLESRPLVLNFCLFSAGNQKWLMAPRKTIQLVKCPFFKGTNSWVQSISHSLPIAAARISTPLVGVDWWSGFFNPCFL